MTEEPIESIIARTRSGAYPDLNDAERILGELDTANDLLRQVGEAINELKTIWPKTDYGVVVNAPMAERRAAWDKVNAVLATIDARMKP